MNNPPRQTSRGAVFHLDREYVYLPRLPDHPPLDQVEVDLGRELVYGTDMGA